MKNSINFAQSRWPMILFASLTLAAGMYLGWQLRSFSAAAEESPSTIAQTEVNRFFQALSGNGALGDVLGDGFQLIRTDGRRYDRTAYLATPASVTGYGINQLQAFETDGVLTTTFLATATEQVGGVQRETTGLPRMAVFSKVDGVWKLQAYANLGVGLASGIDEEAKKAVETWVGAVASGDSDAVRNILAPEFQLVRSDGAAYDAAQYLAGGIPKIDAVFDIVGVTATGFGDYMVVRYGLNLHEAVADGRITGTAPRLTVFRRQGDTWLVVAHANFARVEK